MGGRSQERKSVYLPNRPQLHASDLASARRPRLRKRGGCSSVAMIRANDDLHLVMPHRFFIDGQYARG